jgi:hypothetical protein
VREGEVCRERVGRRHLKKRDQDMKIISESRYQPMRLALPHPVGAVSAQIPSLLMGYMAVVLTGERGLV